VFNLKWIFVLKCFWPLISVTRHVMGSGIAKSQENNLVNERKIITSIPKF
jgi:hypothetical protein